MSRILAGAESFLFPMLKFMFRPTMTQRERQSFLIAVNKGGRLINMDSQAPNKAVEEWLKSGGLFSDIVNLKREKTFRTHALICILSVEVKMFYGSERGYIGE